MALSFKTVKKKLFSRTGTSWMNENSCRTNIFALQSCYLIISEWKHWKSSNLPLTHRKILQTQSCQTWVYLAICAWERSFSTMYFTLEVENTYFESKSCIIHCVFYTMHFTLWRTMYFSQVNQNNGFYTKLETCFFH